MRLFEKICISIRHLGPFKRLEWLWDGVRPFYERALAISGRNGLVRRINMTDTILILPELRAQPEIYEPDLWKRMMAEVRIGDIAADVGAFTGVYTIVLAKRVGPSGKVIAFEPDPKNFDILKAHTALNKVQDRVELVKKALSAKDGYISFRINCSPCSSISPDQAPDIHKIECTTIDLVFAYSRVDILKIDVEGYEEEVLKGGISLLSDSVRCPRAMYIEVHPYAWRDVGTTSESLLNLIKGRCGYQIFDFCGRPVNEISRYGWIIALKNPPLKD